MHRFRKPPIKFVFLLFHTNKFSRFAITYRRRSITTMSVIFDMYPCILQEFTVINLRHFIDFTPTGLFIYTSLQDHQRITYLTSLLFAYADTSANIMYLLNSYTFTVKDILYVWKLFMREQNNKNNYHVYCRHPQVYKTVRSYGHCISKILQE